MNRIIFILLFAVITCFSAQILASDCKSPSDYVHKLYSTDGHIVQYELSPSISYKEITVVFFGKRDQVLRNNTIVKLNSHKGTFSIPERVFIPPTQLWFNFVVTDTSGCKMWGLVNEVPIQGTENRISIGNPSGKGKAFYLKPKRQHNT